MRHPERDALAALVLGEPADVAVADHVEGCPSCGAEVDLLRATAAAARRLPGEVITLERPPEHVWDRIAADVAGEPAAAAAPPRRRRGVVVAAIGFATGVAATLLVGFVVQRASDDDTPAPPVTADRILEQGVVSPLGSDTQGRATLVQTSRGWELRIRLERAPQRVDGFVQAWMLDPTTDAMVALGVLDGKDGTFALPGDLDLAAYTSVDLSLEPYDGDPVHSAVSLARGPLTRSVG